MLTFLVYFSMKKPLSLLLLIFSFSHFISFQVNADSLVLYLDFEGGDSRDLSGLGHDGTVDGSVTISNGEAFFDGGHIDFPGIDMNEMINGFGDGSYTFATWV